MIGTLIRRPLVATLLVAIAVHGMAVFAAPRVIMWFVLDGAAKRAGVNTATHAPPVTAANRFVPMPSPDLLYSTCVLDLDHGPINVSVSPGSTYLSLAIFDGDTNNVFVTSDRASAGKPIHLQISSTTADPPGAQAPTAPDGVTPVRVTTDRALLLLRALAATPEMAAISDAARHTLTCAPAS